MDLWTSSMTRSGQRYSCHSAGHHLSRSNLAVTSLTSRSIRPFFSNRKGMFSSYGRLCVGSQRYLPEKSRICCMHKHAPVALVVLILLLCACGDNPDSQIVGLMISPVSANASVGTPIGFTAALQYVDGHHTSVSNVSWSTQGSASLIIVSSGSSVTVQCVRTSDYFAGGYVPDTIMGKVEVGGQTYTGTASLVCR
jgi:hypothetical protein